MYARIGLDRTGVVIGDLTWNYAKLADGTSVSVSAATLVELGANSATPPGYDYHLGLADGPAVSFCVHLTAASTVYTDGVLSIAQTGDAFARLGVAGAGLTALGDTRLAYLDAAITSRPSAGGIRTALGMASANLDTQLADLPTVAEFNARTVPTTGGAGAEFTAAALANVPALSPGDITDIASGVAAGLFAGGVPVEESTGSIEEGIKYTNERLGQLLMDTYMNFKGMDFSSGVHPITAMSFDGTITGADGLEIKFVWIERTAAGALLDVVLGTLYNLPTGWVPRSFNDIGEDVFAGENGRAADWELDGFENTPEARAAFIDAYLRAVKLHCKRGGTLRGYANSQENGAEVGAITAGTLSITIGDSHFGTPNTPQTVDLDVIANDGSTCYMWWDRYGKCLCNPAVKVAAGGGITPEQYAALAKEATVLGQFGVTWGLTYPLVRRDGIINVPRGDVSTINLTLGASFPLAGRTVYFCVQKRKTTNNTSAIVNRAMTITSETNRTCTITLTAAETVLAGVYHFEVELRDTGTEANPSTAEAGTLNIIEDLRK